jgi:YVTN family beta-propeller protein
MPCPKKSRHFHEVFVLGFYTLTIMNRLRNTITRKIPVSGSPFGMAVNPLSKKIYITALDSNRLMVVDIVRERVTASVRVGIEPSGVAVYTRTNRIYVANGGSDSISVISGTTHHVIRTIHVKAGPEAVAVNNRTNRIYVTHPGYGITVIDGNNSRINAWIPLRDRSDVNVLAIDQMTNRIFVTNPYRNTVTVVDGNSNRVIRSVKVGKMPSSIAVDPYRHILYTASSDANSISIINAVTYQVLGTIRVQNPSLITLDSKKRLLYVVGQKGRLLYIYQMDQMDTRKLLSRIPLSEDPIGLACLNS